MCTHNASGHGIGCQAVHTHIYIYGDKHTSVYERIEISLPNLSEGGSLRSPINIKHICHILVCILKLIVKAHTTKKQITMLRSTIPYVRLELGRAVDSRADGAQLNELTKLRLKSWPRVYQELPLHKVSGGCGQTC